MECIHLSPSHRESRDRRSALAGPWLLLLVLAGAACHAQEATPPVDMRDPVAVVQAYAKACEKPDVEAALALVSLEEGMLAGVKNMCQEMAGQVRQDGEGNFMSMVAELTLMPLGGKGDLVAEKQLDEGETAVVTLTPATPARKQFVLAKQADGTWRIDLAKSIARTTGKQTSFFLAQAKGMGARQGRAAERGPEDWRVQERGRRLVEAITSYAEANGKRLPAAETWMDDLEKFMLDGSILRPAGTEDKPSGWAINRKVAGQPLPEDWYQRRGMVLILRTKNPVRNAAEDIDDALGAAVDMNESLMVGLASGEVTSVPPGMTAASLTKAFDDAEACQSRLRALSDALRKYARANNGFLPPADSWCDKIALYMVPEQLSPEAFKCPARPELECGWALNSALAGTDITKLVGHGKYVLLLPAVQGVRNEARELPKTVEEGWHLVRWGNAGGLSLDVAMLDGTTRTLTEGQTYPQPTDPGPDW